MSQTTTAGSGASQQAQDALQDAAGHAREKAQEGADRAREGLRGQIDQRSTQAGRQVSTQSDDIRSVAQQLRDQGKDGPARLADRAADRAQRVGAWLEESDADQILSEVEDFARRNPWAIALGGLALGFAASRMLKASSSDRYHGAGPARAGLPQGPPAGASHDPPVATTPGAQRYERLG
jgi:hypothetical protein